MTVESSAEAGEPGAEAARDPGSCAERAALLFGAAWITLVLAVRWPLFGRPTIRSASAIDAAVFAYAGELVRRGGTPYVSYWDHKPPLVHLIDAAALTLSGGRIWGLWLAAAAGFLLALVLGHRAMLRAFGAPGAILGTTYLAFSLPALLAANMIEGYLLPVQWAAVLLFVTRGSTARPTRSLGLGLGALGALAVLLKPNLFGAPLSVALAASLLALSDRQWRAWLQFVAGGLLGAATVIGAVVAYLGLQGALGAFVDQVFRYNFGYASATWGERARAAYNGLGRATVLASAAIPVAGWMLACGGAWRWGRRSALFPALIVGAIWLPIELSLAATSGRNFPQYFTPLFAPLSFLAAVLSWAIADRRAGRAPPPRRRLPLDPVVVALAAAIAGYASLTTVQQWRQNTLPQARDAQVARTVAYVHDHTSPGEAILVWGHAADLYLLSGRRAASRFIYPLPLLTPGYADSALVATFMRELRATPPALIIDVSGVELEGELLTPPLDRWDPDWMVPTRGPPDFAKGRAWWSMTPALKSFYDHVARDYLPDTSDAAGRWTIYRRKR